jgi:hypothetical protein
MNFGGRGETRWEEGKPEARCTDEELKVAIIGVIIPCVPVNTTTFPA